MNNEKYLKLKDTVYEANMDLVSKGLVIYTFGNVSQIDRKTGIVAIKPSGVDYDKLSPDDIVLLDLLGNIIDSRLKPSSDTKTHLKLYSEFPEIGAVVHTHSRYATAFAQAKLPVKCLGTTHSDYFYGDIPCTDVIEDEMLVKDYEEETGNLIVHTFKAQNIDYHMMKACLVACHGPFTWGKDAEEAIFISVMLEEIAMQNYITYLLNPDISSIKKTLMDKHYFRKHGKNAYYGQKHEKLSK
ncbi:MAG: L-ribulose-5-phosphate 4-epimerase AraD [Actinobacteria bacterium]|nr:L-ribulose-5-phosphate 4-epimerase AraD [Actinomycetota bacterium]